MMTLFDKPSPEFEQKAEKFLKLIEKQYEYVQSLNLSKEIAMQLLETAAEQAALKAKLELNKNQIQYILTHRSESIDKLLETLKKQQGFKLRPNAKLGLNMMVALTTIYYAPSVYGSFCSNKITNLILGPLLGKSKASHVSTAFSFISEWFFKSYTLGELTKYYVPQYTPLSYLAAPLSVLVWQKGGELLSDPQFKEASNDFFDLLNNQANDEVYERHQDCWLTTDVSEFLNGFWNRETQKTADSKSKDEPNQDKKNQLK